MKPLILMLLCLIATNYCSAQQTRERALTRELQVEPNSTKTISTKTLAPEVKKNQKNTEAYKFLGLDPQKATEQEYSAAKEKLYVEQPEKYAEFKVILHNGNAQTGKHPIKRSYYGTLSPKRKAQIDANPQSFEIVD